MPTAIAAQLAPRHPKTRSVSAASRRCRYTRRIPEENST